jgi:hypothetical protein
MGRLQDMMLRPFERARYRGTIVPDYVSATLLDEVMRSPGGPPPKAGGGRAYVSNAPRDVKKVAIDNGFWAQLMPRDQSVIDVTDEWPYDPDTLDTGPATIITRRVPRGQAWHIDNMYFFARALGGVGGTILLGPADLAEYFLFRVFVSSSQLSYDSWEHIVGGPGDGTNPKASFPFLNDRIGSREAKFGVTLFEGEVIRALVQERTNIAGFPPNPFALVSVGFRYMGVMAAKATIEDYLRLKKWEGTA